jgi:hypothetical protein
MFLSSYDWHRIISSSSPSVEGAFESNSKNDKPLVRGGAFLIWLDASPQLSIGQSPIGT